MTWRLDLRPASFRGEPGHVRSIRRPRDRGARDPQGGVLRLVRKHGPQDAQARRRGPTCTRTMRSKPASTKLHRACCCHWRL